MGCGGRGWEIGDRGGRQRAKGKGLMTHSGQTRNARHPTLNIHRDVPLDATRPKINEARIKRGRPNDLPLLGERAGVRGPNPRSPLCALRLCGESRSMTVTVPDSTAKSAKHAKKGTLPGRVTAFFAWLAVQSSPSEQNKLGLGLGLGLRIGLHVHRPLPTAYRLLTHWLPTHRPLTH